MVEGRGQMRRWSFGHVIAVVVVAVTAAGCKATTPITPSPTPTPAVAETFTGGIGVNGAMTFTFVAGTAGAVSATLSTLAPDISLPVGLAMGTWNGTVCQIILPNDKAVQGTVVNGQTTAAASLCVRISDTGSLTGPITFEILVVHP
jgi:hypothetical protein